MFVRWKRRKKAVTKPGRRPRRRSDAGDSLYCVLIESRRIEGKPRQRVVCYLGSVDEGRLDKTWLRVDFWDDIKPKLDRLSLTRTERQRIEDSIQQIVPRVPEEQEIQFKQERRRYLLELETRIEIHRAFSALRGIFRGNRK
jgi:hypothetical protein